MTVDNTRLTYAAISEAPSDPVSAENIAMAVSRYRFAAEIAAGGDVLEVACSTGHGFGLLAERARRLFGGDFERPPLLMARQQIRGGNVLAQLDGQALPFRDASFDTVVLFEAIYYVPQPAQALAEALRVLRPGGSLVLCFPNRDWPDFNRSPGSHVYYSAAEAAAALVSAGFEPRLYGGFVWREDGLRAAITSAIRRAAVRFNLIPNTMRAKALLKRLFYGSLVPFPADLRTERERYEAPTPLSSPDEALPYKVIYAVGVKAAR